MPLQAQLQQQVQPRLLRNRLPASIGQQHQHRSTSGTRHSTGMYYTEAETDLAMTAKAINEYYNTIRYPSDISSGYSSAADTTSIGLSRTASMSSTSKQHRIKPKRQEDKLLSTSYTTLPRSKKAEAKANANANIAIANSANKLRIKHDK